MPYSFIDRFYALLFVLLPIVQPLKSPFPITWSMLILVVAMPYVFFNIVIKQTHVKNVWPVFLFMVYRVANHGTSAPELLTSLLVCALAIVLVNNLIDVSYMFKIVIAISAVASFVLFVQVVFFYIFGKHIMLISPYMLRTPEMTSAYYDLLSTGLSGSMYRPSAFFLEPSQVLLFFMPGLFYLVMKQNQSVNQFRVAIIMSLGIFASTSGMGIAFVVILWMISYLSKCYVKKKLSLKAIAELVCLLIMMGGAFFSLPIVQKSVERIFFGNADNQYSAIQGRIGGGEIYLSRANPSDLLFGMNLDISDLDLYLSGFYQIVLTEGFVGFALYALIYIVLAIKMKNRYSLFAVFVLIWTYFANIYLIHYFVFFLIFAMYGLNIVRTVKYNVTKVEYVA